MSSHDGISAILTPLADPNLRFPLKPKLVQDLVSFAMPDGLGIQIRGLEKTIIFRGRLVETAINWLIATLDGSQTVREIIDSHQNCSAEDVVEALLMLFRKGVICEASPPQMVPEKMLVDEPMRRQLLFWGRQVGATRNNNDGAQTARKLENKKIVLLGGGMFGAATFDLLTRSGCHIVSVLDWNQDEFLSESTGALTPEIVVKLAETQSAAESALNSCLPVADLLVTALRNSPKQLLETVNRLCIRYDCKWLHGHDNSSTIEIGPTIDPYSTGCYRCMQIRQTSAHDYAIEETLYDNHVTDHPSAHSLIGESISSATLAASILCEEAIRILSVIQKPAYHNAVLTITRDGAFEVNRFRRVPRCPDCYRGNHARLVD